MSYGRQVDGQPIPGRKLDYSRQKLATLDESALNEPDGIKLGVDPNTLLALASDQIAYGVPKKPSGANVFVVGANQPWNLNSDTNVTDIHLTADPNNLGSTDCSGAGTILDGFDDWSNLQFNFQDSFEFADGVSASACTSDPSGFTTCGRDRLTDKNDFTQLDAPKVSEIKKELTKEEADTIAANAAPLFTITMTDSPDPVKQGQQLTYTVTVQNKGPKPGTNVTVIDTLPPSTGTASADFVSARSSTGSCTQASGVVTCNLGSVAVGSSATVTIVVKSKGEGTLTNSAGVSSDPDPTLVQSQVSQTTTATKGGP
jgi:uncharacterized repeat protein (TIGR01451 family)